MYAYRVANVKYSIGSAEERCVGGDGAVWISSDSIFIKDDGKWYYISGRHISDLRVIRQVLKIKLRKGACVEIKSKNVYILNALYHYIEGALWRTA